MCHTTEAEAPLLSFTAEQYILPDYPWGWYKFDHMWQNTAEAFQHFTCQRNFGGRQVKLQSSSVLILKVNSL